MITHKNQGICNGCGGPLCLTCNGCIQEGECCCASDVGQLTPEEWYDIYPELKLNIDGGEYVSIPSRQGYILLKVAIVSAIDGQPGES